MGIISMTDLRIDVCRVGGSVTVRVCHIPSGETAVSDPHASELQARNEAIALLEARLQG